MDREYLIQKWLNGELSEEELKAFENLEDSDFLTELILEAQRFNAVNHLEIPTSFVPPKVPVIDLEPAPKRNNLFVKLSAIAAAVILIGLVYTTLNVDTTIETVAEAADRNSVILPDASSVELNAHSTIIYGKKTWKKNRSVHLEGEAFFDVEKGEKFDVLTKNGKVSVLGTEFNVFSRDSTFKVSCYEGLVAVTFKNEVFEVPAGESISFISDATVKRKISSGSPAWLAGLTTFSESPLGEVFAELERQFDIDIKFQGKELIRFSGGFEHNDLEQALQAICLPLGLEYRYISDKEIFVGDEKE